MLVDGKNVLESERLEVKAVASVVIGRHRFGIAVDHDGLVTIIPKRERSVAAAVIEFDSLAYAVGPAAENDDFLLLGRWRLVLFFVRRIKIRCVAFELSRAGIDELEYRF